jgi:hypothetical protein
MKHNWCGTNGYNGYNWVWQQQGAAQQGAAQQGAAKQGAAQLGVRLQLGTGFSWVRQQQGVAHLGIPQLRVRLKLGTMAQRPLLAYVVFVQLVTLRDEYRIVLVERVHCVIMLKVSKGKNFYLACFTLINPMWVGGLGSEYKLVYFTIFPRIQIFFGEILI